MTVYRETIADLRSAILKYKKGIIDLDALKASVWRASSEIVSVEERELRSDLQQAEAELDSLQFTVDDDLLFDETLKVVTRIESFLLDD